MSDPTEGDIDTGQETDPKSAPVAPPVGGEQPGSTPAPGDTPAPETDEQKAETAEKQTRREARAFATLRRENRELYRRLGGLEAMLHQAAQPPANGEVPAQRPSTPPVNEAVDELNRSILDKIEDEGKEYEEVVEKITDPKFPISVAMRDYLATSDKPAVMAKALADDPREARRISLLSDRAADRAMEQLEARVSAKPVPRTTRALPPVRTVGGSSSVRTEPGKMGMDDYAKWFKTRST